MLGIQPKPSFLSLSLVSIALLSVNCSPGLRTTGSHASHMKDAIHTVDLSKLTAPEQRILSRSNNIDDNNYVFFRSYLENIPKKSAFRDTLQNKLNAYLLTRAKAGIDEKDISKTTSALFSYANTLSLNEIRHPSKKRLEIREIAKKTIATFQPAGDVRVLVPAYIIAMDDQPINVNGKQEKEIREKQQLRANYEEMRSWYLSSSLTKAELQARSVGFHALVLKTAMLWPSISAMQEAKHDASIAKASSWEGFAWFPEHDAFQLALIEMSIGNFTGAQTTIRSIVPKNPALKAPFKSLLHAVSDDRKVDDWIGLTMLIAGDYPEIALRIGRLAIKEFPDDPMADASLGLIASKNRRHLTAASAYNRAFTKSPNVVAMFVDYLREETIVQGTLLRLGLHELIGDRFVRIRSEYDSATPAQKKHGKMILSQITFITAVAKFNDGRTAEAQHLFQSVYKNTQDPRTALMLAKLYTKLRDGKSALMWLENLKTSAASHNQKLGISAVAEIQSIKARIYRMMGRDTESAVAQKLAMTHWKTGIATIEDNDTQSELHTSYAKDLIREGNIKEAVNHTLIAADIAPKRMSIYADAVAMLSSYGQPDAALQIYHRALTEQALDVDLEMYCSGWILLAEKKKSLPVSPIVLEKLSQSKATGWQKRLADFFLGKVKPETLQKNAGSPGEVAEAKYYSGRLAQAESKIQTQDHDQARRLFKDVIESKMVAFFEYDMALFELYGIY